MVLAGWFFSGLSASAQPAPAAAPLREYAPVNPRASDEAKALLHFFYSISGQHTVTGQHNTPSQIDLWSNRAFSLTGKYPGLYGQDFGFSGGTDKDSILAREMLVAEIKRQHRSGAIITVSWHALKPTDDEPVTFRESVQAHLSEFEWQELLTPGTHLYQRWCTQVDEIAGYLKQLRDAHIPVLFRPYHEINGDWFWWNGRPGPYGSAALYRQLYDRYVNLHHLDNLVWVWNTGGPSKGEPLGSAYYPGHEYVDMLSIDIYGEYPQASYDYLLTLGQGRPIALGEVGAVPTLEVLNRQPKWTYFLIWSEFIDYYNPLEPLVAVFNDPRQLNRDDAGLARPMAALRQLSANPGGLASSSPVTPEASKAASALLARLSTLSGKNTLSGQDYGRIAQHPTARAAVQSLGKSPALFGADLAVQSVDGLPLKEARTSLVQEALEEAKAGAIIALTWLAPRPTDDEPASEKSAQTPLSDFEWAELLTPGTRLHERWLAQVDGVAASLKTLQEADVPVLWRPYPGANGKAYWWSGHKGPRGTGALYRQLFDRLVRHHHLNNLVWVWTGSPGGNPEVPGAIFHDTFPGLLYVDALAIGLGEPNTPGGGGGRMLLDRTLLQAAVGKPIGISASPRTFLARSLERQPNYAWFLLTPPEQPAAPPPATPPPPQTPAAPADPLVELRALYALPRVISR